jgi:crossover junction endodeoxyribonuclease RuvC
MAEVIRILGIDPGSAATGWGVVEQCGARLGFVAAGVIRPKRGAGRSDKLAFIFAELNALLAAHRPCEAAVEATFVNSNPQDALVLGEARGVALLAPAAAGLAVAEYAANSVKKAVTGQGHAAKEQVQAMVRVLLPASGRQAADAADALAVAIAHAHMRGVRKICA